MAKPSVYSRILRKAADLVGGERALARYLKVPRAEIYAWMSQVPRRRRRRCSWTP